MSGVTQILLENGLMLLGGVSGLLSAGALFAVAMRSPLHQQRICEISLLATPIWAILAITPLPRMSWERPPSVDRVGIQIPHAAPAAIEIPPELIARPQGSIISKAPPLHIDLPQPISNHSINWRMLIVRCYLFGALLALAWLATGHYLLWRMMRSGAPAPPWVRETIGAELLKSHRATRILISRRLARPITCSTFWPTILLPQTLVQENCRLQLRQALLHEFAHIRQRDSLGNLLFSLALPLLYFHPLYWLLRRRACLARELVVDDLAAQIDGKETYVEQLIELARVRAGSIFSPVGAMGILQIRSHFYRRVQMLLERRQPLAARCSNYCRLLMTMIALTIVASAVCLFGARPASAQATTGDPTLREQAPKANAGDGRAAAQERIDQLTAQVKALQLELQAAKTRQRQNGDGVTDASGEDRATSERRKQVLQIVHDLNENQIAMVDQRMRALLHERDKEKASLQSANQQFGPSHPTVITLQRNLEQTENKIREFAISWRDMQAKMAMNDSGGIAQPNPADDAAAIRGAKPVVSETAPVGGVQLDLVQLGNSIVDASSALQLAQVKLNKIANAGNAVASESVESAKVNLVTAEKRLRLLLGIAKLAMDRAQSDLDQATKLRDKGLITDQSRSDYRSKVEMLKLIIDAAH